MKELVLTLTQKDVEVILEGLSKLPLEKSLDAFVKTRTQAFDQLNPKPEVQESIN